MTPRFDNYINDVLEEAVQHISKECEAMVERVLAHPLVKSTFKMDGKTWDTQVGHPRLKTGERFTFYAKHPETLKDPRYTMMTTHYTSGAVKPLKHWLDMLEDGWNAIHQKTLPDIPYGKGKTAF